MKLTDKIEAKLRGEKSPDTQDQVAPEPQPHTSLSSGVRIVKPRLNTADGCPGQQAKLKTPEPAPSSEVCRVNGRKFRRPFGREYRVVDRTRPAIRKALAEQERRRCSEPVELNDVCLRGVE